MEKSTEDANFSGSWLKCRLHFFHWNYAWFIGDYAYFEWRVAAVNLATMLLWTQMQARNNNQKQQQKPATTFCVHLVREWLDKTAVMMVATEKTTKTILIFRKAPAEPTGKEQSIK